MIVLTMTAEAPVLEASTHSKKLTLIVESYRKSRRNHRIEDLNFRYQIDGDEPHWRPSQAFDDGRKVYIQFPARLDQGEAPPLFVVGETGDIQLVNYRVKGRYYIVDRLFARAELRLGEQDQQVVTIGRTAQ